MTTTSTARSDSASHIHVYDAANPLAERSMRIVASLNALMMLVEIVAGWLFHSMALLADGWHMSSHALALGLSAAAYAFARRLASDERFAFGTWKIEVLGGYTSALFLAVVVSGYLLYESVSRLSHPVPIAYNEALAVATLGLLVNIASVKLLGGAAHHHSHDHDHDHAHAHEHHDLNLRSAYVHIAADAATSVLAIAALLGGKLFGLAWLDPVMGFIGTVVVIAWAITLLRDTARVLLDAEMDAPVVEQIRATVRASPIPAQIQDLHVWRVARNKYACLLVVVADPQRATPAYFRNLLARYEQLAHITVEVNERDTLKC